MKLSRFVHSPRITLTDAIKDLTRLATLERTLGLVCIFIPFILILFDGLHIRNSISAYYSMSRDQVFYFSLSVAAMLFIVNGVVKEKHIYNTILGIMLSGVILFNCDAVPIVHFSCASVFFGGNGFVILFFSSKKERSFKIIFTAIIVVAMLGCFLFHWFSLFWAEWISLAIIAIHYFIEASYTENVQIQGRIIKTIDSAA